MGCLECSSIAEKSTVVEVLVVPIDETMIPNVDSSNLYRVLATIDDRFMAENEQMMRAISLVSRSVRRQMSDYGHPEAELMVREFIHYSPALGGNILVLVPEEKE